MNDYKQTHYNEFLYVKKQIFSEEKHAKIVMRTLVKKGWDEKEATALVQQVLTETKDRYKKIAPWLYISGLALMVLGIVFFVGINAFNIKIKSGFLFTILVFMIGFGLTFKGRKYMKLRWKERKMKKIA